MFRDRSVVEIMVLAFTAVVALSIVALGVTITLAEIRNPGADTSTATTALFNLISGMMGALLGLLAGRSDDTTKHHPHPSLEPPPTPTFTEPLYPHQPQPPQDQ